VAISALVVALDDEMLENVLGRGGVPDSALSVRLAVVGAAPPLAGE
jgi:hypothetical protein